MDEHAEQPAGYMVARMEPTGLSLDGPFSDFPAANLYAKTLGTANEENGLVIPYFAPHGEILAESVELRAQLAAD